MNMQLTRVGLIIIGDEILLGRREDKHFKWARSYFSARRVDIAWVSYLGDDFDGLAEQFRTIRARREICFSFGGIGATPDDRTRQAIAAAFDVQMARHPEAARLIENRFGAEAYPNRILMADLPAGASLVPNAFNDIPGFFLDEIYCLPGFPEMAWPMVEWVVERRYRQLAGEAPRLLTLQVPDVRESELIGLLTDLQQRYADVRVSCLPRFPADGRWHVELGFRGTGERAGAARQEALLALTARGIQSILSS